MSIYKLTPSFKDYLWGGTKLKEEYNKKSDLDILAESWEVSSHPDGPSYVDNQTTLEEHIKNKGRDILGERGQTFDFFPILVKFIDAKEALSIQVHPSNDYALVYENQYGKTEMWYVLEADDDSYVYYGTKKEITPNEYREAIENNTILDVLNKVNVKKGDVIFVEAGTIHAIGTNVVICEIQQNSNVTYRVYDFNRQDKDGNYRELHIDKAIDVSNLTPLDTSFKPQGDLIQLDKGTIQTLVKHPLFHTEKILLDGSYNFVVSNKSFEVIVCLEGEVTVENNKEIVKLIKGETCFIEANSGECILSGNGEYLKISV